MAGEALNNIGVVSMRFPGRDSLFSHGIVASTPDLPFLSFLLRGSRRTLFRGDAERFFRDYLRTRKSSPFALRPPTRTGTARSLARRDGHRRGGIRRGRLCDSSERIPLRVSRRLHRYPSPPASRRPRTPSFGRVLACTSLLIGSIAALPARARWVSPTRLVSRR